MSASWDASTYERVASPQSAWADEIIARATFTPGERVLDAGCGGGGVTTKLVALHLDVTAVDADLAMVQKARETLPPQVPVLHRDILDLDFDAEFDAVFSCAVFHWITDHDRLFERLHAALKPGGRLVAQCGGHGNIARVLEHLGDRSDPHFFATAEETEERLTNAGFEQAKAWLEPKPTHVDDMETYIATVMLHGQPDAAEAARRAAAKLDHLDYVRLNIEATA